MRNPLRIPSPKSLLAPRKVRRTLNVIPSGRTVASKSARRGVSTARKTTR